MVRIGFDLSFIRPGKTGGIEFFTRGLLSGFQELGFGISDPQLVLFLSENNADAFSEFPFPQKVLPFENSNHMKTILWDWFFMEKEIRSSGVQLMFVPAPVYPLRKSQVPKIMVIHDTRFLSLPDTFSLFQKAKRRIAYKAALKRASLVIFISEFSKKEARDFFSNLHIDCQVIFNPVVVLDERNVPLVCSFSKLGLNPKRYFFSVSKLDRHKNFTTLVEMMYLIKRRKLTALPQKLVLAGPDGNGVKKLKRLVSQLDLENQVSFLGFVSQNEKFSLMKESFCFLFPSLYEGFGIPPIEAMGMGCPVITTRCGSIPEVTHDRALYVNNPTDPEEWLEKVQSLELQRMRRIPLTFEKFSKRVVAEKYIQALEKVLENQKNAIE